jgi:DNA-binding LacI/PurR family transcriptional regulator
MNKTDTVRNQVFRAILHGEYRPGDRIPTEREMAILTKTSRVTVRRAYADLEKGGVLDRARSRGTRISSTPRGNPRQTDLVALLTPLKDPFALEFIDSLEKALAEEDALLVLRITDDDPKKEEEAVIEIVGKGVRNVVVWPSRRGFAFETFTRLRILGVNMVFFDRVFPGAIADFIGLDNAHAIASLVDLAVSEGKTDMVFVSHEGLEADSTRVREEAFLSVCHKRKLANRIVRLPWRGDTVNRLRENKDLWFPRPTVHAALCINDVAALTVRSVMGPDLAVYGIDGLPQATAAGIPTYQQPMREMAAGAIRLLSEQQKKGEKWKARRVYCKGQLLAPTRAASSR